MGSAPVIRVLRRAIGGRTWRLRKTGGDYYGDKDWRGQEAGPRGREEGSWENVSVSQA